MDKPESAGRVIQSVQRAFELLERVAAEPGGARLSDLADTVGLNRSTAHNLLASLEALGYVQQDGKGAPYRLTNRVAQLAGPQVEAEQTLRERIRPLLDTIVERTGETAYLAFATGTDYLCADAVQSPEPLRLTVETGEREPLLGTAIGHALLADDPTLSAHLEASQAAAWAEHADGIQQARRSGYALDLDGFHPGVSCVALSVGSGAAIGVAGPTSRLPPARLREIAGFVAEIAQRP